MPTGQPPSFSAAFDIGVTFGPDSSLSGRFGSNVLDELIVGIDEYQAAVTAQPSYQVSDPRCSQRSPGSTTTGSYNAPPTMPAPA